MKKWPVAHGLIYGPERLVGGCEGGGSLEHTYLPTYLPALGDDVRDGLDVASPARVGSRLLSLKVK